MAAEAEEARDLLQKTQQERDEARTDEVLLKLERDKAVQMCATAVDEGEQLKKKYKNLEKGCAQEKPQKSSSPSLDTRKTEQTSRRRASSSEDGDSSSLTGDTVGCRTSSKAQREGGDKTLDTEKVGRDTAHRCLWFKGQLTCHTQTHRLKVPVCFSGNSREEPEERP